MAHRMQIIITNTVTAPATPRDTRTRVLHPICSLHTVLFRGIQAEPPSRYAMGDDPIPFKQGVQRPIRCEFADPG